MDPSSCEAVIDTLAEQGIRLEIHSGRIIAFGPGGAPKAISDDVMEYIRLNKPEFVKLLSDKAESPPLSQDGWPFHEGLAEDPEMYASPLHDYDLKAAQKDPVIAKVNLEYIVEDLERSVKLSKNAARYLAICLRKVLDDKTPEHAFNLADPQHRKKTVTERNISLQIEYELRILSGEKSTAIKEEFKQSGISESTRKEISAEHKPFCKKYAEQFIQTALDPPKHTANEIRLSEYIEKCKRKKKTRKQASK